MRGALAFSFKNILLRLCGWEDSGWSSDSDTPGWGTGNFFTHTRVWTCRNCAQVVSLLDRAWKCQSVVQILLNADWILTGNSWPSEPGVTVRNLLRVVPGGWVLHSANENRFSRRLQWAGTGRKTPMTMCNACKLIFNAHHRILNTHYLMPKKWFPRYNIMFLTNNLDLVKVSHILQL